MKRVVLGAACLALVAGSLTVGVATSVTAAASPFQALAGTWSGSGTARLEGGKRENMRCRGYYNPGAGGLTLTLSIRCANAASKVELRANLNYANGAVTGSWEERTYNQQGNVTGTASANKLSLVISGGISGSLSMSVEGSNQSVSLSTQGSAFQGMNIAMSR